MSCKRGIAYRIFSLLVLSTADGGGKDGVFLFVCFSSERVKTGKWMGREKNGGKMLPG